MDMTTSSYHNPDDQSDDKPNDDGYGGAAATHMIIGLTIALHVLVDVATHELRRCYLYCSPCTAAKIFAAEFRIR